MKFTMLPHPDMPVPEGVYAFGANEELRKGLNFRRELLSYTKLKRIVDPDDKPSPYVAGLGNLVSDRLLLGPDAIPGRYYFHGEQIKYNTKAGKAWRKAKQEELGPNVVIIRPKEREEAERLITSVLENPETARVIKAKGLVECGLVAELNGFRFRSWLDKLCPKAICDLKTSRTEDSEQFLASARKYGYDVQAALYQDSCERIGLGKLPFYWLVISKLQGGAFLVQAPEDMLENGRRWYRTVTGLYGQLEAQRELTADYQDQLSRFDFNVCPECAEVQCDEGCDKRQEKTE